MISLPFAGSVLTNPQGTVGTCIAYVCGACIYMYVQSIPHNISMPIYATPSL